MLDDDALEFDLREDGLAVLLVAGCPCGEEAVGVLDGLALAVEGVDAMGVRVLLSTVDGAGAVHEGGLVGFERAAGREAGRRFIDALRLFYHVANIGDARTLVLHPASTTHQQLTAEQLEAGGVSADLIRISVGIEDPEDILWDLDQALTQATGENR